MTDTLHSRILRTIEDWNRDLEIGRPDFDLNILAGRITENIEQSTVTKNDFASLRHELETYIKIIDRTLTIASNSDAEKERDEFAIELIKWLGEQGLMDEFYGPLKETYLQQFKDSRK